MKAIVRSEYGSPDVLELKEVAKPTPKDKEVLVRIRASSVNMADVDYLFGRPKMARLGTGMRKPRNTGVGLDVAGQVEAVGKHVTRFLPGQDVIGDLTAHGHGAFAEYVCAPQDAFALKPTELTLSEAATIPQAAVMALQGIRGKPGSSRTIRSAKTRIQLGQHVLINGAGGNVGPFAVQIAKSFGAEVTAVDHSSKLDMLRKIGADHVIDYTKEDFTKMGQQYDWILDVAAYRSVFECRRVLKPKGVYVIIPGSIASVLQAMVLGPLISMIGRRKVGMLMWKPFIQEDVEFLRKLIRTGEVKPIIDRTYPLDQVPDALRYQQEGHTLGKIVITV